MKGSASLLFTIFLLSCISCSWYQESFCWSILRFDGENTERLLLEFDDTDLEDAIILHFQNGSDFPDESMSVKFHADQPWVSLPGMNDNTILISSGKENKLNIPIKIHNEGLSSGEHQAIIKITADNGQRLEAVIKMTHLPRIEVGEEKMIFAVNETEKELCIKSHDYQEKVLIKKPADAMWLDVSSDELLVPKYIAGDEATIGKITVSVNRSAVNYGSYKANLTICSENGADIAVVPVEMLNEEFGDQVTSSDNILFKILGCQPKDDGELNISLSVKNTGSLDNEVVSFLGYSYSSDPKYPAYAIDNCGNVYEAVVRFRNYASSKAFASGEEAEATVTVEDFKRPDISVISYLFLPLEGRAPISFQNIGIQGRPTNVPDFTPITSSTLLDAPRELAVTILRSFYDSSTDLHIEYIVENASDDFVEVFLDASHRSDCAYDDSGKPYDLETIALGLEKTSYSTSANVWLPPHVKCRGVVTIEDVSGNSLQYLKIPVLVNGSAGEISFYDVEIEGKIREDFNPLVSSTLVSLPGGLSAGILDAYHDSAGALVVEYFVENGDDAATSVILDGDRLSSCVYDDYGEVHNISSFSLGDFNVTYGKSDMVVLIPGVKISGTVKVNSASTSCAIQYLQIPVVYNGEKCFISFRDIEIRNRIAREVLPKTSSILLVSPTTLPAQIQHAFCDSSTDLHIEYIVENASDDFVEVFLDASHRSDCAYDDSGKPYDLETIGLGLGKTSYSTSANVRLPPHVKCRGVVTIEDVSGNSLQYLRIPVSCGNQLSYIIFNDVEIEGKIRPEMPGSLAEAGITVSGCDGAIDFYVTKCYDTYSETIVEFRIENHLSQQVSVIPDFGLCYSIDEYSIFYSPKKITLAGVAVNDELYKLPVETWVIGKVSFQKIDEISSNIKELQMSYVVDGESYSVKVGSLAIEGRERSLITPQELWHSNGVVFNLIGCYEDSGNLIIDYLLNNTTANSVGLVIDDNGRVYDDMANEYPIELAGGSYYECPELKPKCSYRSQVIVRTFSPDASAVSYFKLVMDIGAVSDVVMELRNIEICDRQKNELPIPQLSYDVVQLPDKIEMQFIKAEFKDKNCYLNYILSNNSSAAQNIKWNMYSTDSYAIIGEERHYITTATIGFQSFDKTYVRYELPGNVMVSGVLVIPDVAKDCKLIDKLILDCVLATPYEFANIGISE